MLFYFVFASVVVAFSIPNKSIRIKLNKINITIDYNVISYILIALFIGLRNNIGVDDPMHLENFNQIKEYGLTWRNIEPTFTLISKFVISISGNVQLVYLIFSVASCLCLYYISTKLVCGRNRLLFLLIFLSFSLLDCFVLMRQFAAISFSGVGYIFWKSNRKKSGLLVFLLAFFTHYSSIVVPISLFILPFIAKIKPKIKVFILCILYIFQYIPIAQLIRSIVVNTKLDTIYYISYYLGSRADYRIFLNNIGIVTLTYLIMYCILHLYTYKKESISNIKIYDRIIINAYEDLSSFAFIYFCLLMLFAQFGYATRIAYYFSFFAIAYLCNIVDIIDISSRKAIKIVFIISLSLLFMYSVLNYRDSLGNNPFIPYDYNLKLFN